MSNYNVEKTIVVPDSGGYSSNNNFLTHKYNLYIYKLRIYFLRRNIDK